MLWHSTSKPYNERVVSYPNTRDAAKQITRNEQMNEWKMNVQNEKNIYTAKWMKNEMSQQAPMEVPKPFALEELDQVIHTLPDELNGTFHEFL